MRSSDALLKIKDEIVNDPRNRGYSGKLPSETAILMNQDISKDPPEFLSLPVDRIDVLRKKLTSSQVTNIITSLKDQGIVTDKDFADRLVEIKTKRSDDIQLGEIMQGDVEQALK